MPVPPDPGPEQRFQVCVRHARNAILFERDPEKAVIEFRKHLAWYTKGLREARRLRQELFEVTTLEDIERLLLGYLATQSAEVAA
jgi:tRNA-dihydrouridine synthase